MPPHFVKSEGSTPHSQEPEPCLYPQPDLFSPRSLILLLQTLILYCYLRVSLQSGLFPSGILTKILHSFLFSSSLIP